MQFSFVEVKTKGEGSGIHCNSLVPPDRSNFVLFWFAVGVWSVMSRLNEARVPDGKGTDGGKGGVAGKREIKKNPTIISSAKNATTYVEDRTGTLVPEG